MTFLLYANRESLYQPVRMRILSRTVTVHLPPESFYTKVKKKKVREKYYVITKKIANIPEIRQPRGQRRLIISSCVIPDLL